MRKFWTNQKWAYLHSMALNLDCDTSIYPHASSHFSSLTLFKRWLFSPQHGSDKNHLWKTQVCWLLTSHTKPHVLKQREEMCTKWLSHNLEGKISTQQTDDVWDKKNHERHYRNQSQETQSAKAFASHLPAFPYRVVKSFLLCKLLKTSSLLPNHFPKALVHFREAVISWDVAMTGTSSTAVCSWRGSHTDSNSQAPSPVARSQSGNAGGLLQSCRLAPNPCREM